jgi:hypothetical protein
MLKIRWQNRHYISLMRCMSKKITASLVKNGRSAVVNHFLAACAGKNGIQRHAPFICPFLNTIARYGQATSAKEVGGSVNQFEMGQACKQQSPEQSGALFILL